MDWPQLDALADRLRWRSQSEPGAFDSVDLITVDGVHAVNVELLVQVVLGDIDYDRQLACYAGTDRRCARHRRLLAERVSRLMSLP